MFNVVGVAVSSDKSVIPLVARKVGSEWELVYCNEPYGTQVFVGFTDIEMCTMEAFVKDTDGNQVKTETFTHMIKCLADGTRGVAVGIVLLEDGFLVIHDFDIFSAHKQGMRVDDFSEKYTTRVDDSEAEDYYDDDPDMMELINYSCSF